MTPLLQITMSSLIITSWWWLQATCTARQLVFDVRDFGAVADGQTDNSKVINRCNLVANLLKLFKSNLNCQHFEIFALILQCCSDRACIFFFV